LQHNFLDYLLCNE